LRRFAPRPGLNALSALFDKAEAYAEAKSINPAVLLINRRKHVGQVRRKRNLNWPIDDIPPTTFSEMCGDY